MIRKISFAIVISVFLGSLGYAQEEDYSKYAGFVDLPQLTGFKKADRSVEVYLKKPLLSLVAALNAEDPTLQQLIENLALIRVEQFEIEPDQGAKVQKTIDEVAQKLEKQKWDKLVKAVDGGEHVEIFIKSDNAKIAGLLVMALEDGEASFINIVGELDLSLLGKLGAQFDIPGLEKASAAKNDQQDQEAGHEEGD
ncbi:DUF4252 domain-containing protein [bacterium]|nr:DUF4252 domain-containing protein [bacterium]